MKGWLLAAGNRDGYRDMAERRKIMVSQSPRARGSRAHRNSTEQACTFLALAGLHVALKVVRDVGSGQEKPLSVVVC